MDLVFGRRPKLGFIRPLVLSLHLSSGISAFAYEKPLP